MPLCLWGNAFEGDIGPSPFPLSSILLPDQEVSGFAPLRAYPTITANSPISPFASLRFPFRYFVAWYQVHMHL